jgi:hypothetical protein
MQPGKQSSLLTLLARNERRRLMSSAAGILATVEQQRNYTAYQKGFLPFQIGRSFSLTNPV